MQGINRDKINIHPLSAKGKYYVDVENCLWCTTCEEIAPNNFKIDEENYRNGSLVYKQPETPEEENSCKEAMLCCPHEAIHNDGEINNQ